MIKKENYSYHIENLDTKQVLMSSKTKAYFHPASLIKLFVAFMAEEKLFNSHCDLNSEYKKAIYRSIKDSDNDALSYLVDLISSTNSGPELNDEEFENFYKKRKQITEFFLDRNYSASLVLQNKCFDFDYYGRDRQLKNLSYNQVCVEDLVKLLKEILEKHPSLLDSMYRNINDLSDYQSQNFSLKAINNIDPSIESCFSKAGWNSSYRHELSILNIKKQRILFIFLSQGIDALRFLNFSMHLLACSRLVEI